MYISDLLMGGAITTSKSRTFIRNIDRVEVDAWGKLRIRGDYMPSPFSLDYKVDGQPVKRWTILDPYDLDFSA